MRVRMLPSRFLAICFAAGVALLVNTRRTDAQTQTPSVGVAARAAARTYREKNEGAIVTEFAELLSLPNLASDSTNIRRNANHLLGMLGKRGFVNTRLLTVPNAPPAVYGELPAPGASRTLVLYAHYDGQPLDPKQWSSPPWSPVLRTGEVTTGGRIIPIPGDGGPIDPEARLYARSAGDGQGALITMLPALRPLPAGGIQPAPETKVA